MDHPTIFHLDVVPNQAAPRVLHWELLYAACGFQPVTPSPKAIVIVDDEKAYIDIMATMLTEQLGSPVVTFTRPLDALAALPTLDVGVVVTDCNMPQFSGFEFIRRASILLPGVPFILMTGNAQHYQEEELVTNSPLRAILPKPFGWRKLADAIILHAPVFSIRPAKIEPDLTSN